MEQLETPPAPVLGGYTARVLPAEEWGTLTGELALPPLAPAESVVVVVAQAGVPIARWVALNTVHLEGLLVTEAHRLNPAVNGKLFFTMLETLHGMGIPEVLTLAESPEIGALAEKVGFHLVPGSLYKLSL